VQRCASASVATSLLASLLCCSKTPFSFEVDRYNGQPSNNRLTFIYALLPEKEPPAIVGLETSVEMNLVRLELCATVVQVDGNCSVQRRRCSHLSNPPFTQRSFPTGTRDGGQREPRAPRFLSLGRRNVCRDLAAVGTLQQHEPNTGRTSRLDEIDCPQTGRQSGKGQRMRHFSIADLARTNHTLLGRLARVRCAVSLLIPVFSVISRHEWPCERK
jgi:hypothetical protein